MNYLLLSDPDKFLMKAVFALAILLLPVSLAAQQSVPRTPNQLQASQELNLAAQAYREGNFAQAQQHSERALLLDPENRAAPVFIARTIHAQYKPGVASADNQAKAREAILAYEQILARLPKDEESYKAIAYLYGALKEEELFRNWIQRRAYDSSVEADKRAEAYIVLASKDWDCSFKITELPTNKFTSVTRKVALVHYKMPEDAADFAQAQQCATRGLEMAEEAITLAPENESAWSYKTNLLLELSKLAEMSGDKAKKTILMEQYEEALKLTTTLSEAAREKSQKALDDSVPKKPFQR